MNRALRNKVSRIIDDLEPDEQVVDAIRATPGGELERVIGGAAGGVALGALGFVVGAGLGERAGREARAAAEEVGVQAKGVDVMLVLTDRRLLVYQLGMTGKPKERIGSLSRCEIADLNEGRLRILGQQMPALKVTTTSGASTAFGVARIRRAQLASFLEAYRAGRE